MKGFISFLRGILCFEIFRNAALGTFMTKFIFCLSFKFSLSIMETEVQTLNDFYTKNIYIFYHSSNLSISLCLQHPYLVWKCYLGIMSRALYIFTTLIWYLPLRYSTVMFFAAQSLKCLQSWQVMFFQKKSLVWARVLCTPTHDFKKMPKWHSAMRCQIFRASANPECLSKRGAQFGEIFLKGVFLCSGNWKFQVKFFGVLQF